MDTFDTPALSPLTPDSDSVIATTIVSAIVMLLAAFYY